MALKMKQFTIRFDPETGGVRRETDVVAFNSVVRQAEACLKGWEVRFQGQDRELHHIHIDIDVTSIAGNVVNVAADFGLRDRSGTFDDPYYGFVQGVLIAEVD